MAYSERRIKADPFTDLLFNVLLAFTLLMFLAIIFMNPIPKTGVINPKAESVSYTHLTLPTKWIV